MTEEWITDRPPTEADGDRDGDVLIRRVPGSGNFSFMRWSFVGIGAPWRHTSRWKPPTEPDRIAALEQRMAGRIAALEAREDAAGVFFPHFTSRLEKLEGAQPDGSAPRWTLDRIAALEQRVTELEAQMRPTAETFEQPELSYQRAKAEQLRSQAALLLAQANLVEADQ